MNRDGSGSRRLALNLDRDIANPRWSSDGKGLFVQFDDLGDTKIAYVTLTGDVEGAGGERRRYVSGSGPTPVVLSPWPGMDDSLSR